MTELTIDDMFRAPPFDFIGGGISGIMNERLGGIHVKVDCFGTPLFCRAHLAIDDKYMDFDFRYPVGDTDMFIEDLGAYLYAICKEPS